MLEVLLFEDFYKPTNSRIHKMFYFVVKHNLPLSRRGIIRGISLILITQLIKWKPTNHSTDRFIPIYSYPLQPLAIIACRLVSELDANSLFFTLKDFRDVTLGTFKCTWRYLIMEYSSYSVRGWNNLLLIQIACSTPWTPERADVSIHRSRLYHLYTLCRVSVHPQNTHQVLFIFPSDFASWPE